MGDHGQVEEGVVRVGGKRQVAVVDQHVGRVEEPRLIDRPVAIGTVGPKQNQEHDKTGKHKYRLGWLGLHRLVRGCRRRASPGGNLNYSVWLANSVPSRTNWWYNPSRSGGPLEPSDRRRLIAVEPEPTRYGWMRQHFSNHGVSHWEYDLIHAAVCEQPGRAYFYAG
jgi:hypothetical protein